MLQAIIQHLDVVIAGLLTLAGVALGASFTLLRDYLRERKDTQRELREVLGLLYVFYADVFLQAFNLRQIGELLTDDLETVESLDAHRQWVLGILTKRFKRVRERLDAALVTISAIDPLISGRFYLTQEYLSWLDKEASNSTEEARKKITALVSDLEVTLERIRDTAEDICEPAGVTVDEVRSSFFTGEKVKEMHAQTLDNLYG